VRGGGRFDPCKINSEAEESHGRAYSVSVPREARLDCGFPCSDTRGHIPNGETDARRGDLVQGKQSFTNAHLRA
jgi:hypothetical protein